MRKLDIFYFTIYLLFYNPTSLFQKGETKLFPELEFSHYEAPRLDVLHPIYCDTTRDGDVEIIFKEGIVMGDSPKDGLIPADDRVDYVMARAGKKWIYLSPVDTSLATIAYINGSLALQVQERGEKARQREMIAEASLDELVKF